MEKALARFVNEMESEGAPISHESLRDQAIAIRNALKITNFEFSDGWMSNFEKRFSFKSRIIHGKAGSAVTSTQDIQTQISKIKEKINEYGLSNVYNFDETALFYAQVPRRTISKTPLSGQKDDKTRITIALACNADGSHKHKLFFIGHAAKPPCFGGKTGEQHGHWY
ncbi:hypothetical protein INT45_007997 [Circinella minor]|uniref:HTH CENPB-type domain-containing protein n=1 Tax=Circinella minor TaxID=1195481 RepID=A0A8H7VDI3_9FUNG|nr:hypothetical protein INT45_007997 [Circinella minor]